MSTQKISDYTKFYRIGFHVLQGEATYHLGSYGLGKNGKTSKNVISLDFLFKVHFFPISREISKIPYEYKTVDYEFAITKLSLDFRISQFIFIQNPRKRPNSIGLHQLSFSLELCTNISAFTDFFIHVTLGGAK